MARGDLNLELISNEKLRKLTFKKRKEGLMKKIYQFSTLCDVSACFIIYPSDDGNDSPPPEVWPENNPDEVRRLINLYKRKGKEHGLFKTYALGDYFDYRSKRMVEELVKLRERNKEAKFPTWMDCLGNLSEMQLRDFATVLDNKIVSAKNRIDSIKQNHAFVDLGQNLGFMLQPRSQLYTHLQQFSPLIPWGLELDLANQHFVPSKTAPEPSEHLQMAHYLTGNTFEHNHKIPAVNESPMMMMLVNENTHDQSQEFGGFGFGGGGSSGGGIQQALFNEQVYNESSTRVVENLVWSGPGSLMKRYGLMLQPMPPPYMQLECPAAPPSISPQMLPLPENVEANDMVRPTMQGPGAWF